MIMLCAIQPPALLPTPSASALGSPRVPDSSTIVICIIYNSNDREPVLQRASAQWQNPKQNEWPGRRVIQIHSYALLLQTLASEGIDSGSLSDLRGAFDSDIEFISRISPQSMIRNKLT